jgi:protein-tyrosine-phosphatase
MAEAIAKHIAKNRGFEGEIISAGVFAVPGDKASVNAATAMEEMNLDLSCHISQPLTYELLEKSDLVLTMTGSHKLSILSNYPSMKDKVFTLMEYIGENKEVSDPFGGDIATYRRTAKQLKEAIEKLFIKIMES